jgi:hypothetical protein
MGGHERSRPRSQPLPAKPTKYVNVANVMYIRTPLVHICRYVVMYLCSVYDYTYVFNSVKNLHFDKYAVNPVQLNCFTNVLF